MAAACNGSMDSVPFEGLLEQVAEHVHVQAHAQHQLAQDWPDGCPTRKQYDAGWKPGDPITAALADALNSRTERDRRARIVSRKLIIQFRSNSMPGLPLP